MAVKLIAWYEDQWMPPGTDRAQFQALSGAYGATFQMIHDWSEADVPFGHVIVVVDERGEEESGGWTHPADAVYVFGRSGQDLLLDVPGADHSIRVSTPRAISLFGIAAASIVMRDRNR